MNPASIEPPVSGNEPLERPPGAAPRPGAALRGASLVALLALVAVAAGLRFLDLGLLEFKGDEAVAIHLALPMAEGEALPQIGLMSSVGLNNPPLFIWLTALPTVFSVEPSFVTAALCGGLNVLAVGLTFVLFRRRLGGPAAFAAAAIFAVGVWPVLYGRKLWAQDCLQPFMTVLVLALMDVWERRRSRLVGLVPVMLCCLWQLHFSGIPMGLVTLLLLAPRWRELHWPAFGVGLVAAVLLTVPYLRFQAAHGWPDVEGLANMARGKRADGAAKDRGERRPGDAFQWAHYASFGTRTGYSAGDSEARFAAERGPVQRGLSTGAEWVGLGLLCVGLGVLARRAARRDGPAIVLLGVLLGYTLLMQVLGVERLYPHYFSILYPVPFLVAGCGAAWLAERWRWVTGAAVALVLAGHVVTLTGYRSALRAQGGAAGDYGVLLEHKEALADFVVSSGLTLGHAPGWEYGHLVNMRRDFGDMAAMTARSLPLATGDRRRARVLDGLRQPAAATLRCSGRRDFGPLVLCLE